LPRAAATRRRAGRRSARRPTWKPRCCTYPRPVAEGFANTALAVGDFKTAEAAYREALGREPGSGRAYFGVAAALKGQNKMAEAEQMTAKAMRAWDKADTDLPQLRGATNTAGARQR
jgi:tetratricopeptide (TPR) repeat protein